MACVPCKYVQYVRDPGRRTPQHPKYSEVALLCAFTGPSRALHRTIVPRLVSLLLWLCLCASVSLCRSGRQRAREHSASRSARRMRLASHLATKLLLLHSSHLPTPNAVGRARPLLRFVFPRTFCDENRRYVGKQDHNAARLPLLGGSVHLPIVPQGLSREHAPVDHIHILSIDLEADGTCCDQVPDSRTAYVVRTHVVVALIRMMNPSTFVEALRE